MEMSFIYEWIKMIICVVIESFQDSFKICTATEEEVSGASRSEREGLIRGRDSL